MALFPVHRANRLIKIVIAVHNQLNSLTTLSAHTGRNKLCYSSYIILLARAVVAV